MGTEDIRIDRFDEQIEKFLMFSEELFRGRT